MTVTYLQDTDPMRSSPKERDNSMQQLTDLSPMPFGKFKGEPMQEVPASYLHWLWTSGKQADKQCPVADYIRRNLSALKQEHPDALWS